VGESSKKFLNLLCALPNDSFFFFLGVGGVGGGVALKSEGGLIGRAGVSMMGFARSIPSLGLGRYLARAM